jgi:uncharacterized protein YutE (UPF0331/DUF86 family)
MKKEKIILFLEEARKHKDLLNKELKKLEKGKDIFNFSKTDNIIFSDAFIFRFIKLQSVLGEKIFPLFYEYLTGKDKREATFIDILNTMEKYKIITSADFWKEIREIRNIFVHDYPQEDKVKKDALKRAIDIVKDLFKIIDKIQSILDKKNEK